MSYTFTPAHPPLLKDHNGNILEIPASDLEGMIGVESSWSTDPTPGDGGAIITKKFTAKRRLFWSLSQIPHHYNADQEIEVKYVTGFSKTQKESMEKNIGGEVGGDFFGLTAKVTADLKLTSDYTQEWHEETTVTAKVTYQANNTYCTWRLNDIVELLVETVSVNPGTPPVSSPSVLRDSIISVVAIYEDSATDPNRQIIAEAMGNLNEDNRFAAYLLRD